MKHPKTNIGDLIEITEKYCGRQQPNINPGSRLIVNEFSNAKDSSLTLVCKSIDSKAANVRINENRFNWKVITLSNLENERLDNQTKAITDTFTFDEQLQIAIVPLLYNQLAWNYAEKAVELGKTYRVEVLKKLSRTVREKKREYVSTISRNLDNHHMNLIENGAKRFADTYATDLTLLQLSLMEQFANKCPDYPYRDLRTTALMSKLMIILADRQNLASDALIEKRLGYCKRKNRMAQLDSLYTCMEAMGGDNGKVNLNTDRIELSLKILMNKMKNIQFGLTE